MPALIGEPVPVHVAAPYNVTVLSEQDRRLALPGVHVVVRAGDQSRCPPCLLPLRGRGVQQHAVAFLDIANDLVQRAGADAHRAGKCRVLMRAGDRDRGQEEQLVIRRDPARDRSRDERVCGEGQMTAVLLEAADR